MISALRKISSSEPVERAPGMVREMFLHHPRVDFMDMFATHPPIEKRVEALVKFAGGRDLPFSEPEPGPWGASPPGPWG
jgi:heat shock protein HtpX